eukprot:scaffold1137_cov124-Skeletonema_marinoi.AAC.3
MWLSLSSRALLITQLLFQLCKPSSQFSATVEQKTSPLSPAPQTTTVDNNPNNKLDGSWSTAKQALRNPNFSVVSISGLDHHLSTLQSYFCGVDAPSDVDLRMRVRGPGTEYMDATCLPWEYVALRSLGVDGLGVVNGKGRLKMARELEFIVMKGDYYDASVPEEVGLGSSKKKLWSRAEACVHRSPPGNNAKRVILSLDLADGGDDQEWEERGRKRNWRVGMTQRKSHLVS